MRPISGCLLSVFIFSVVGLASALAELSPMALSADEQAWVKAHPVVRVGCAPDFPPFSFLDRKGLVHGIDADFLTALGQKLGIKFELQTRTSWTEVYAAAERREYDMLSSTANLPERKAKFDFTHNYTSFPLAIITRSDGPLMATRTDLLRMRVAGARDYAPTLNFKRANPELHVDEYDTIEQALLAVASGKADAVTTNIANASYVIKLHGLSNLKLAGVLSQSFEQRLAVRNDWPELVVLLDRAIAEMNGPEMASILDRWIKVDYAAVIRWDVVGWWLLLGVVFVATIVVLVVSNAKRLGRELAKRVALQRELEITNLELKRRNDELGELMNVAAHDLRSPLTAIMLTAQQQVEDRPQDEGAENVIRCARQMVRLIDDLLQAHALERGTRAFREEQIEVKPLIHAVAATVVPNANQKAVSIDLDGVETAARVQGDPGALGQVIDNLLVNAVKFSPRGRSVAIRARDDGKVVRIEVRDHGPGVPATERERIFTKYARGTARPTEGEKSTGLGLAIVREIVAAMNGRVWCENGPHGGAVFFVLLPVAA